MKNRSIMSFWIGFLVTAVATAWLYWLWRRNREVLPEPMIVTGRPLPQSPQIKNEGLDEAQAEGQIRTQTGDQEEKVDSLESISGIGPTYARRLNEAGVYTYEQLAALSPQEVKEVTGVTRWDPADWVMEAKRLAGAG